MSRLDLKLIRDLRHLKGQILSVGLVMACGLAMMIMSRSLIVSLEENRDSYYDEHRFAHVFAHTTRAPDSLASEIAAIPGVAAVETSIARYVTLDIPGLVEPAVGLINSLPDIGEKSLNRLFLRMGRLPESGGRREVAVSEPFAIAHGLRPGDTVAAVIYGMRQVLRIAGIVLSPEFVFESRPGAALPDNKTFGVLWMPYTGDSLVLNFETSAAGSIRIELQDERGHPIPGYELENFPPLWGDKIAHTVTWTANPRWGTSLKKLEGTAIRLRVVLRDADLYSIQFRSPSLTP